jgi:hypothetical protein
MVAELGERLELAHRKTDVALRFVDWVRLRRHFFLLPSPASAARLHSPPPHTHTHNTAHRWHRRPTPPQYAEKGEAYEYNAGSLERHMNSLALQNLGRAADGADMRTRVFGGDASVKAAFSTVALGSTRMSGKGEPPGGGV